MGYRHDVVNCTDSWPAHENSSRQFFWKMCVDDHPCPSCSSIFLWYFPKPCTSIKVSPYRIGGRFPVTRSCFALLCRQAFDSCVCVCVYGMSCQVWVVLMHMWRILCQPLAIFHLRPLVLRHFQPCLRQWPPVWFTQISVVAYRPIMSARGCFMGLMLFVSSSD